MIKIKTVILICEKARGAIIPALNQMDRHTGQQDTRAARHGSGSHLAERHRARIQRFRRDIDFIWPDNCPINNPRQREEARIVEPTIHRQMQIRGPIKATTLSIGK
jgi:hypothetical protein